MTEEDRDSPPPLPLPALPLLLRAVDPRAVENPLAAVETVPSPADKMPGLLELEWLVGAGRERAYEGETTV